MSLSKKKTISGAGSFFFLLFQGYNFNTLGRYKPNIKDLGLQVLDKNIFKVLPIRVYVKK